MFSYHDEKFHFTPEALFLATFIIFLFVSYNGCKNIVGTVNRRKWLLTND